MSVTVGNVTRTDDGRFEVLGLVSIQPSGFGNWASDDLKKSGCVGTIFRCLQEGSLTEIGYLLVADVSQDPQEPDISTYHDSDIPGLDRYLEREVRNLMARDGRQMVRWMSSHLNHGLLGKTLITAYIAQDQGRERQYIDARTRIEEQNVVVAGCFDVSRAKELANPVFSAIRDARPLKALPYKAMELLASGRVHEASGLAGKAVQQNPDDWYAHYALGQCLRYAQDYPKACATLSRANELAPRQSAVLLALAIAQQLNAEYPAAVETIRLALEIDPDDAAAINTLAMTQKLMGDYEKSAQNYEAGLNALARTIVKSLHNAEDSPRLPPWHSRNNLWTEYALFGAIYLTALTSQQNIAWPSDEMAQHDARTEEFKGVVLAG
jgi:tetratricopeptide (TPR) repeat protein